MFALFQGIRARRLAEQLCGQLYAEEPVQGSWVCASEPTRFVVRVFCGHRMTPIATMMPPWERCVIVAVDKGTWATEQVIEDALYRPVLR
jgi:hypothetical protein